MRKGQLDVHFPVLGRGPIPSFACVYQQGEMFVECEAKLSGSVKG